MMVLKMKTMIILTPTSLNNMRGLFQILTLNSFSQVPKKNFKKAVKKINKWLFKKEEQTLKKRAEKKLI